MNDTDRQRRLSPQAPPRRAGFSLAALGLGHRAYVVFVLGSVIPLAFLALLTDLYVLPHLGDDQATGFLIAVILVGILAMLSFIVLARTTSETVLRLQALSASQAILIEAAHALADTGFVDVIAERATRVSADLVSASASFTLLRRPSADAAPPEPVCAGFAAARILAARRAAIEALAEAACRDQQTLVLDRDSPPLIPGLVGTAGDPDLTGVLATPLVAHGQAFGTIVLVRVAPAPAFSAEQSDLVLALARLVAVALHGAHFKEAEQNFFTHITEILVQTLDLHVDHQAGHSKRVAHYATRLGREVGLDGARLNRLFFAAVLHDIGMLRVPAGPAPDKAAFREHCRLADEMLRPITLWSAIAPLVRNHHERYDGAGYPDGLAGEAIPIESRIITLADVFDVLTAAGSYRPRMEIEEALQEIERCAGGQFDPTLVKAFLDLARRGELET
jgi:putative nucleotidyltransferase with HDIG domain